MLVIITSRVVTLYEEVQKRAVDIVTKVYQYIQKLIQENYQKFTSVSIAIKMFSAVILLGILPVNIQAVSRDTYPTAVKLDTNSPNLLVLPDHQVRINTNVSNIDANKAVGRHSKLAYASLYQSPSGIEHYLGIYKEAANQYGIPWEILAAVHYVESGASGSTGRMSYTGAQGPMQFMPGTWRAYGVDGNNDGVAEVNDVSDAIYGAANLLAAGGAADGNVDAALYNYNHAQWYVNKVKNVASGIQ